MLQGLWGWLAAALVVALGMNDARDYLQLFDSAPQAQPVLRLLTIDRQLGLNRG